MDNARVAQFVMLDRARGPMSSTLPYIEACNAGLMQYNNAAVSLLARQLSKALGKAVKVAGQ